MSIQAHDIGFSYGPRFALSVEHLAAADGEFLGIIGSNGSGKTTLMKLLAGMFTPARGRLLLDGMPLGSYPASRRARHLAYVPQSYRPVFEYTVEQTVLLGRMPHRSRYGGFERDEDLRASESAISLMELEPLRHEPVTRLSGGELQRVMIAKALAQETGNLMLDEPNSHLDIAHQQSVLATVRRMTRERGICVVASIHDLNLASICSDRIVAMAGGRAIAAGTPAQVLTRETLREVFGADLVVEPNAYGDAPAVRYRYAGTEREAHV